MNTAKKFTTRQQITNAFITASNKWMLTPQILEKCEGVAKQTVYGAISAMATATPIELERRGLDGGMYEYRLPEATYARIVEEIGAQEMQRDDEAQEQSQSEQPEVQPEVPQQTTLPEVETSELAPAQEEKQSEPQVQVVEEGKRTRQKMWNAEDQRLFCLAYLKAREEHPLHGFEMLAEIAQKAAIPADKRKADLKSRHQIPWFDREIERSKVEYDAQKAVRLEEERMAREQADAAQRALEEARVAEERQMLMMQALHGAGNDLLIGELMRRGQSLIETMLINALQSPNVQRAFVNTVFGGQTPERRHHERPNFQAPEQKDRPRLERIGVLGINRPVHQNQLKQRMTEMFDLRFANVDGNASLLKSSMAGCDLILVLTDSVPHRTTSQLKAANLEWTPIAGDKREIENFLSRRYMEKNNGN